MSSALTTSEAGTLEEAEGECSVRVYVRIRPLNQKEKDADQKMEWKYTDTAIVEDTQNGQRQYAYDACFGVDSSNKETYEKVGRPVVIKAMEGFNGTVFTYGQTGSGKTWTMRGCDSDPGMMILCIRDIFEFIKTHVDKRFLLKVSYMEVYNEEINDLLNNDKETNCNLKITSEDAARGAVIGNLQEVPVTTPAEFMDVLHKGESNRSYASTSMNDNSSRSHVIYRVAITIFDIDDEDAEGGAGGGVSDSEDLGRVSYMNLVDLAGSERQKSTKTTGVTLKEGANINKSLLALGAVINKLGEASKMKKGQKPVFIPYRDSKLTRILKQSLGGNTLTSILCAISPAPMFREETVSTLKFGQLCKLIKNQVSSNVVFDDRAKIKNLLAIISEQKAKLEELDVTGGGSGLGGGGEQYRGELQRAFNEKRRIEKKMERMGSVVEELKKMVKEGGGDISSVHYMQQMDEADDDSLDYPMGDNDEVHVLKDKIRRLEARLKSQEDFEKDKKNLEELERQEREEIEKEKDKLEEEKKKNAHEKEENMKKFQDIENEKDIVRNLETKMDDMNSQLRQKLGVLRDQETMWEVSIQDLKKKEDNVKEWERDHAEKEKTLHSDRDELKLKMEEFNLRMAELAEREKAHSQAVKDLEEREQGLRVTLNKIYQKDSERASAEKRLQALESQLKKREGDCDLRDRETQSRRKDNDNMFEMLTERDRTITGNSRRNDEKETALRDKEEKLTIAGKQLEKQQLDIQKSEKLASDKQAELLRRHEQLQAQEQDFLAKMAGLKSKMEECTAKEEEIALQNKGLREMQLRMSGIDERERKLNERIEEQKQVEEKYYSEIAQISQKHRLELSTLEAKIMHQLQIMSNFQSDLDRSRTDLAEKTAKNKELERLLKQRDTKEEQLLAELRERGRLDVDLTAKRDMSILAYGEDDHAYVRSNSSPGTPYFRRGDEDLSDDGDEASQSQGGGMYQEKQSPPAKGSKGLMKRLADSQRALHHILESHNASQQVRIYPYNYVLRQLNILTFVPHSIERPRLFSPSCLFSGCSLASALLFQLTGRCASAVGRS